MINICRSFRFRFCLYVLFSSQFMCQVYYLSLLRKYIEHERYNTSTDFFFVGTFLIFWHKNIQFEVQFVFFV